MLYRCRRCHNTVTADTNPLRCPSCNRMFYDVVTAAGITTYYIMEKADVNAASSAAPAAATASTSAGPATAPAAPAAAAQVTSTAAPSTASLSAGVSR